MHLLYFFFYGTIQSELACNTFALCTGLIPAAQISLEAGEGGGKERKQEIQAPGNRIEK